MKIINKFYTRERIEIYMKKNEKKEEIEENKNKKIEESTKKGFFKKVFYSITKIEKYPEMAVEGVPKALIYISKLVAIIAIILCIWTMFQANNLLHEGIDYINNNFPDFSYKDGILVVDSKEPIIIEEQDSKIGKVIIDTRNRFRGKD